MLWVGTYGAKGGQGLTPIEGVAQGDGQDPYPCIPNASFGVWSERTRTAYFVDEQEAGRVTAWSPDRAGWKERGASSSGGVLPCYLSLDPTHRFLAVANYGDGSVALVALEPESGLIASLADVARHSGSGPDPERQSSPHVHCTLFDEEGGAIYAVDLGLDRIFRYEVRGAKLSDAELAFEAPPGSGPRHLLLHRDGRHALLLTELSAELMLLERTAGGFHLVQRLSACPEPDRPENLGGHLAFAGDGCVLVSNRGHDSIVSFELKADRLGMSNWRFSGGASPRHFVTRGHNVIVAHEQSGVVTEVSLDADADGATVRARLPGAAFVIEIP